MTVHLRDIMTRLEREQLLLHGSDADVSISGITDDSRNVSAGMIFCAWKGTARDSHDFVGAIAQKGAAAALVERHVDDANIPQLVVKDGRRAAAVAASVVYGSPETKLTITGVTGTNGKTTTAWMMRHVLSTRYSVALIGTLGIFLPNGKLLSESLTTPGPVDLARVLATMVDNGVTAISMEVSSHALDQGRVQALRFDAAVFTNLTRDHLDYHGTIEAYRDAKRSFTTLLKPNGAAVVNADDAAWNDLTGPRTIRFSIDGETELRAQNIQIGADGTRFELVANGQEKDQAAFIDLPLVGDYNVQNALGAAGAALAIGMSFDEVVNALNTMPQVPGRLEKIHNDGFTVLRDYAHTPDALERVLTTLRPVTPGRLIVLFGAGGDRDRGKRPEMGAIAQKLADIPIVTSDNPRTENPESIIDEIVGGMRAGEYVRVVNRKEAIAAALEMAKPGDVVLLAGKGHETYQIIGNQKISFDERAIVADLAEVSA